MTNFCLTIAGTDPTSGAGIQADIRTFDRCGVHPFSVITALTCQTATQFYGYKSLSKELEKQLTLLLQSYPVEFVKIGMIPDVESLDIIINCITKYNLFVIYDPVLISSAGKRLSSEGLESEIEKRLFPLIRILTPNIQETALYSNIEIDGTKLSDTFHLRKATNTILDKMYAQSGKIKVEKAVIVKNGVSTRDEIIDFVLINRETEKGLEKKITLYEKKKIKFKGNVHGTGCVFSSALTAFLSQGNRFEVAIQLAEEFFDEKFLKFIELPQDGKVIDLTLPKDKLLVINQIKEVYNYISSKKNFSKLVPEVRLNISGSLANAQKRDEIAGIEGRVTIINGYPFASGEIKFGVSDHTARLILAAKEFDTSINFVINLKYKKNYITSIQEKTDLLIYEFVRENQPDQVRSKEHSTMQFLIKECIDNSGRIPDIIWDKGAMGKEPIIRVFARDSKSMISILEKIVNLI